MLVGCTPATASQSADGPPPAPVEAVMTPITDAPLVTMLEPFQYFSANAWPVSETGTLKFRLP